MNDVYYHVFSLYTVAKNIVNLLVKYRINFTR